MLSIFQVSVRILVYLSRMLHSCMFYVLIAIQLIHKYLVLVINQLDAQHFYFTISLFRASTCFEQVCSSSGG